MLKKLNLRYLIPGQKGFTLIELLVAISITAVIGASIVMAITQIFTVSIADRNRMEAVKQVENALHYINRDAQMASSIVSTSDHFPLDLTWKEWNVDAGNHTGPQHQVTYSLIDSKLVRTEIIKFEEETLSSNTMIVANHISDSSGCTVNNDTPPPLLKVKLIASIGGYKPVSESRTFQVQARPEISSP